MKNKKKKKKYIKKIKNYLIQLNQKIFVQVKENSRFLPNSP